MRLGMKGVLVAIGSLASAVLGGCKAEGRITICLGCEGNAGVIEVRTDFIDTKTPVGTTGYTCSDVGVTTVGIKLYNHEEDADITTSAGELEHRLPCVNGGVYTFTGVPIGGYDLVISYYDMQGN